MIKKGDRVKFLSETAVGEVISIKGPIANILVEDGFEIPALITDLVAVDKQEEARAISRMGVGDGNPVNSKGGKSNKQNQPKEPKPKPQRNTSQYGRISLVDDYEDDEQLDLSYIKSNYIRNSAAENESATIREEEKAKAAPSPLELTDYEIKLCFVPDNSQKPEESESFAMYIVNDSSYTVLYSVARWNDGDYATAISGGEMEDDTKEEIAVLKRNKINAPVKLLVNILLYKPTNYVPQPVEDFTLEISPMKFMRAGGFTQTEYFDDRVLMFTLASSNGQKRRERPLESSFGSIGEALREKGDISERKPSSANRLKEPEIIDLHAAEVLDSTEGLTPGEILKAQMSRFEIAMDLAVRNNRGEKMVFIHGVGSGKLKYEMQKLLAGKYPRVRYQDASFKEYGYGAIMVDIPR